MKRIIIILCFFMALATQKSSAQKEQKDIRQGNKAYSEADYFGAERNYKAAIARNSSSAAAHFNLGDAQMREGKMEEARESFETSIALTESDKLKSAAYHNLGNLSLQGEQPDLRAAIDNYKDALRHNPGDGESRYNLAYAQSLLKEQEQNSPQEQQEQDQESQDQENKDQDKGQKGDNQKKENQENSQDNSEQGDPKNQKNGEQAKGGEEKSDKGQQQMAQAKGISRKDAERMLEALKKEEAKVLRKALEKQAPARKEKKSKDW